MGRAPALTAAPLGRRPHGTLEAEIALVQPQAIVALGATAARQLLRRPVPVLRDLALASRYARANTARAGTRHADTDAR